MRRRRIEELTSLGFELVDSMRDEVIGPCGGDGPFRQAGGAVVARYAPVTPRERLLLRWEGATGDGEHPSEVLLSKEHLHARFSWIGSDIVVRLPRAALQSRWRYGMGACYGLERGSYIVLPVREADALLAALDEELSARANAPFRAARMFPHRPLSLAATAVLISGPAMNETSPLWLLLASAGVVFSTYLDHNRLLVTTEGLTREMGLFPKWTRFVPRAELHTVILRVRERLPGGLVTLELHGRNAKNVPKHYVIDRARTKESAREYAERVMAPEARRVATLLGLPEPTWET